MDKNIRIRVPEQTFFVSNLYSADNQIPTEREFVYIVTNSNSLHGYIIWGIFYKVKGVSSSK